MVSGQNGAIRSSADGNSTLTLSTSTESDIKISLQGSSSTNSYLEDTSLPPSIRNISKIFKPSPFQKPISNESFIIEKPDIYYIQKVDSFEEKPTPLSTTTKKSQKEENFKTEICVTQRHLELEIDSSSLLSGVTSLSPQTQNVKSSEVCNETVHTNIETNISHQVSTPKLDSALSNHDLSATDTNNTSINTKTTHINDNNEFNVLTNANEKTFNDLSNLTDFDFYDLNNNNNNNNNNTSTDFIPTTSNDPSNDRHSHCYSIPITEDKQLAISSFDFNNIDVPSIDDFEKDIAAFQHNDIQYSALIQIPLRDHESKTSLSPSTDSPESSYDINDPLNFESSILTIPRSLDPLPDLLLAVPMYKDLFYHFVYVTADILVPAPSIYPQNPFKTILPSMALSTPHLLALLLAFSANHRARFLRMETPQEVISRLLTRAFQGFIKCLESEKEAKSDTTLTTAILLSSYEILTSSGTDAWKTHMHGARDIVIARDFANTLLEEHTNLFRSESSSFSFSQSLKRFGRVQSVSPGCSPRTRVSLVDSDTKVIGPRPLGVLRSDIDETNVSFFLVRWFAYIDVIGSLSSSKATAFLTTNEDMAQLWGLHDWHLARIKERSLEEIYHSRFSASIAPLSSSSSQAFSPSTGSGHNLHELSMNSGAYAETSDEILNVSARHYGIKVDFLLGVDLDVLPLFSKISFLVRQRRRLTDRLREFLLENPTTNEENSGWIAEWKKADMDLKTEASELSDIIFSLCEAYELRRKQYINNAIGVLERKRRDSSSSNGSSSNSPTSPSDVLSNNPSQGNDNSPSFLRPADPVFSSAIDDIKFGLNSAASAKTNRKVDEKEKVINSDEFIFSEESVKKLNSILKKSEVMVPAIAQLPVSVQAHSQLSIMNTMFCYAAIIQLYRRVMNLPAHSPMVQNVVKHNTKLLENYIPPGSPVEACMSFPIFTTACELLEKDSDIRQKYWLRMKGMERFGIDQILFARHLMEICWKQKRDWPDITEERGWDLALF